MRKMAANAERSERKGVEHLVVGHAAWWIPKPKVDNKPIINANRDEQMVVQKLPFAPALKDLLLNLSFHCYGKLVEHGRCNRERFFWLVCHITALCFLIVFVCGIYKNKTDELVTTLYDPLYPISKVPLPTVTICTQNRISKQAVWRYANELSLKDPQMRSPNYFYNELRALGMYYNPLEYEDYERVLRFQGLLDVIDTKPDELFFDTRERMRGLTPNCSNILVSCRLSGVYFDCQQEFSETLTSFGFCCTINHKGDFLKGYTFHQRFFGMKMGLILTLNSSLNDSFHRMNQRDGLLVVIYEPDNYPDPQSGGVTVRYVKSGRSTLLPVRPKIYETVQAARFISPSVRKCRFWDEMPYNFTNRYTFSKCLSACRARSIYNLCGCLPFQMPHRYVGEAAGRVLCTFQHMECLRHYKFKWLNVITSRAYVPGLEHELQDALYCPECLPSCTEIRYHVRGTMTQALNGLYKPMTNNSYSGVGYNSYGHDSNELAVVHIYYAETHIQYFRQIIKNAWFEIFSTIGSICGIMAGFSLIGICELLFFLAKQLWHACKSELKSERCPAHTHKRCRLRTRTRANGRAKATQQEQQEQQAQEQEQQPVELLILP